MAVKGWHHLQPGPVEVLCRCQADACCTKYLHLPWTAPKRCRAPPRYICMYQWWQGQLKTFPVGKHRAEGMSLVRLQAPSSRDARRDRTGARAGGAGAALCSGWLELPHRQLHYQKWMLVSALKTLKKEGWGSFSFPGGVQQPHVLWLGVGNAELLGASPALCRTCNISLAGCERATGALC